MTSEHGTQRGGLGLTQLGKLPSRIHHGAVMHAQLRAFMRQGLHGCSETLITQVVGDVVHRHRNSVDSACDARHDPIRSFGGKGRDSFTAVAFGHETQSFESQGVVSLIAGGSPGGGEGENLTRTAPPRVGIGAEWGAVECLNQTRVLQRTHRTTYGGR